AGGDGRHVLGSAGVVHSLEPRAEGPARAPVAHRAGCHPGYDVSLYFSVFAKRARHVHVPKEPDGRPSRRRGAATFTWPCVRVAFKAKCTCWTNSRPTGLTGRCWLYLSA